jgi:hypothetical protein
MKQILSGLVLLLLGISAQAQLAVTVSPPQIAGQKAVIQFVLKNDFSQRIESARAVCFLLNEQGQMIGQSTKWVIGGKKDRPALESRKDTMFNFVITSSQPFTSTNLTAKVSFSRIALEGGKLIDPKTSVQIENSK